MPEFTIEQQFEIAKHRKLAEQLAKTNPQMLCDLFMDLYQYHVAHVAQTKAMLKAELSGQITLPKL
jgi:hypothetical protein